MMDRKFLVAHDKDMINMTEVMAEKWSITDNGDLFFMSHTIGNQAYAKGTWTYVGNADSE